MKQKRSLSIEALSLCGGVLILLVCLVCCTDDSPVAPAPDPCCRVADSLQARVDMVEYQLCVVTLVNNERRHQISCIGDWFLAHGHPWPSACDGRPIDLMQCYRQADSVSDSKADTRPDIRPDSAQ